MVVCGEASMERARESGGEVDRLGDRAPIVGVEVGCRCDCTESDPLVADFVGTVPELRS